MEHTPTLTQTVVKFPEFTKKPSPATKAQLREHSLLKATQFQYLFYRSEPEVPPSRPVSPSSEARIGLIVEALSHKQKTHPLSIGSQLPLISTSLRGPFKKGQPLRPSQWGATHSSNVDAIESGGRIFPLADDDLQWERWMKGVEVPPALMTPEEAQEWKSLFFPEGVPTGSYNSSDFDDDFTMTPRPPAKKARLDPDAPKSPPSVQIPNALAGPSTLFPPVSTPVTRVNTNTVEHNDPVILVPNTPVRPRRSGDFDPYEGLSPEQSSMGDQSFSEALSPIKIPSSLPKTWDLSLEDVSPSFQTILMASTPKATPKMAPTTNTVVTSTIPKPKTGALITPAPSISIPGPSKPRTPSASRLSKSNSVIIIDDSTPTRLIPTMDEVVQQSVKAKRTVFRALAASQSHSQKKRKRAVVTPAAEPPRTPTSVAKSSLSTPPQSKSPSRAPRHASELQELPSSQPTELDSDSGTPTRKVQKKLSFGGLLDGNKRNGIGTRYNSQYNVESNMDDISRFMGDDVDSFD